MNKPLSAILFLALAVLHFDGTQAALLCKVKIKEIVILQQGTPINVSVSCLKTEFATGGGYNVRLKSDGGAPNHRGLRVQQNHPLVNNPNGLPEGWTCEFNAVSDKVDLPQVIQCQAVCCSKN